MKSTCDVKGRIQRSQDSVPRPFADCSDEVLARRARAGERGAFVELGLRHWGSLHRIVRNMLVPDASESAEAAFRTALASPQAFPDGLPFRILLVRAAVETSLARLRSAPPLGRTAAAGSLAERIREVLARVDAIDRACYVLRDIEELSWQEAAFVLRTSAQIVRERAHRVRMALAVSLDARLA
jgi:RNA polymerase sigma-70 factor (ECF subfamily)